MLMVRRLKQAVLTLAVHGLRGAEGSLGQRPNVPGTGRNNRQKDE